MNLPCKRIQCDEIWSFVGSKAKNTTPEKKAEGNSDVWTRISICADKKLVPCWHVGGRDVGAAYELTTDLASRLANRVQLTTDAHRPYLSAVEEAFGSESDYAMLVKLHGKGEQGPERQYGPAFCKGARKVRNQRPPGLQGNLHLLRAAAEPHDAHGMRRFTRLTNAFSRKLENHEAAIALHYMHYNFARIHQTLRCTPAMEAGVTDRVWEISDIVALLDR